MWSRALNQGFAWKVSDNAQVYQSETASSQMTARAEEFLTSWKLQVKCLVGFQDTEGRHCGRVLESQFMYQLQVFEMLYCINVRDTMICYWYREDSIRKFCWNPSETVTLYILCKIHQPELRPWIKFGFCPIPGFWMVPEQHMGHS